MPTVNGCGGSRGPLRRPSSAARPPRAPAPGRPPGRWSSRRWRCRPRRARRPHAGRRAGALVHPQAAERGRDRRRDLDGGAAGASRVTGAPARSAAATMSATVRSRTRSPMASRLDAVPGARARLARRPLHDVGLRPCPSGVALAPGVGHRRMPRVELRERHEAVLLHAGGRGGHGAAVELVHARRQLAPRRQAEPKPVAGAPRRGPEQQRLGGDVLAHEPGVGGEAAGGEDHGDVPGKLAQRLAQPRFPGRALQRAGQRGGVEAPADRERVVGLALADGGAQLLQPVHVAVQALPHQALERGVAAGHSLRNASQSRWRQITPLESSMEPPARSPFSSSSTSAPRARASAAAARPPSRRPRPRGRARSDARAPRPARSWACARRTRCGCGPDPRGRPPACWRRP